MTMTRQASPSPILMLLALSLWWLATTAPSWAFQSPPPATSIPTRSSRTHHQAHPSSSSEERNAHHRISLVSNPRPVPGPGPNVPSRAEQLRRLQQSSPDNVYDLLVIGAGATGSGVALDAAARGLRVACIDRSDFGGETSSRSTKLIWAGLKYLASAFASLLSWELFTRPGSTTTDFVREFSMVLHCHQERRYMTSVQPHLVYWLPICVPFDRWIVNDPPPFGHPLFALFPLFAPLVLKFYDALSMFTCPPSYIMTKEDARQRFPQLKHEQIHYCAVFYEGHHNDARTNLAIAFTAAQYGAHVANYVEMKEFLFNADGTVLGARCLDRMTDTVFDVHANKVVLAGGPFTDLLRQKQLGAKDQDDTKDQHHQHSNGRQPQQRQRVPTAVQAASGTHIVLDGSFVPPDMGLLDYYTSDGRFLFIAPWQGHTLIGTTDKKGPAHSLHYPPEEDIEFLVKEAQKYLRPTITRSHVLSAWRGWRPLAADPYADTKNGNQQQHVSRDHVISENPQTGVIFIAGGKWTTWREMAQDVTDRVVGTNGPKCTTANIVLHGGDGYSEKLPRQLEQHYGLEPGVALHLARTYGGCAHEVAQTCRTYGYERLVDDYPYLQAEIAYACRDFACTIDDVISRRTRLTFLNKAKALEALPLVAKIMAHELGWTERVTQQQFEYARLYIDSFGGTQPPVVPSSGEELRPKTADELSRVYSS